MRGCTGVDTSDSWIAPVQRVDRCLPRLRVTLALSAVTVAAITAYGFQTFATPV